MSATVTRGNTAEGAVMQFAALNSGAFFELRDSPTLFIKLHNSQYKRFNPEALVDVVDAGPECIVVADNAVSISYEP